VDDIAILRALSSVRDRPGQALTSVTCGVLLRLQ
jgi:hypothetical protein